MKLNAFTASLILGLTGSTFCLAQEADPPAWGKIESNAWARSIGDLAGVKQTPGRVSPVRLDPAITTVTHAYGRFNSLPAVTQVPSETDPWAGKPVRGAEARFEGLRARRIQYSDEATAKTAGQKLVNMMTDPTTAEQLSTTKAPVVIQVRGNEVVVLEGNKLEDPAVLKRIQDAAWEGPNPNSAETSVVGTFGKPNESGVRGFAIDTTDQTGEIAQNANRTQDAVNTMSEDSPGFRRYSDFAFEERSPAGDVAQIIQTEDGPVSILMAPSTEAAQEVDKLARVVDGRRRDPLEAIDSTNKGNQQFVGTIDGETPVLLIRDEQGNVERRVGSADGETYDFEGEVKPVDAEQQKLIKALETAGWLKDDVEVTKGLDPINEDTLIVTEEGTAEGTVVAGKPQNDTETKPAVTEPLAEGGTKVIDAITNRMDSDQPAKKPQDEPQTQPGTHPAETDEVVKDPSAAAGDAVTKHIDANQPAKPQDEPQTQPGTHPAETDEVVKDPSTAAEDAITKHIDRNQVPAKPQDEPQTQPGTHPAETDEVVKDPSTAAEDAITKHIDRDQVPAKPQDEPQTQPGTHPAETDEVVKDPSTVAEDAITKHIDANQPAKPQDEPQTQPGTHPAETDEVVKDPATAADDVITKHIERNQVPAKPPADADEKRRIDDAAKAGADETQAMMEEMRKHLLLMEQDRAAAEKVLRDEITALQLQNETQRVELERARNRELYGDSPLTYPSYDRNEPVYNPSTGRYEPRRTDDWFSPDSFRRPNDLFDWRNDYNNGRNGYNRYDPFNSGGYGSGYGDNNNGWSMEDQSGTAEGFNAAVKASTDRNTRLREEIRELTKGNNELFGALIKEYGRAKANAILNGEELTIAETAPVNRPYAADAFANTGLLRVTPGPLTFNTGTPVTIMKAGVTPSTTTLKANANTLVQFQGGVQGGTAPYTFVWGGIPNRPNVIGQNVSATFFGNQDHTVVLVVRDSKGQASSTTVTLTVAP